MSVPMVSSDLLSTRTLSSHMWVHRVAMWWREFDAARCTEDTFNAPFYIWLVPRLRSEMRVPHCVPLSEVSDQCATDVDFGALHAALVGHPMVDTNALTWMGLDPSPAVVLGFLRGWEVRARWAGVPLLPPPSRYVFDWTDRIAAVRWGSHADGTEAERLWQTVAGVIGIPSAASVDDWRPDGTAGPAMAAAILRALVEQYPAAFAPIAKCNLMVWGLSDPTVATAYCLRTLKVAAYEGRLRPNTAYPLPAHVVLATQDSNRIASVLWPAVRRHLPRRVRFPSADEDTLIDSVRFLRSVRLRIDRTHDYDWDRTFCGYRLELPEDVAGFVDAMRMTQPSKKNKIVQSGPMHPPS